MIKLKDIFNFTIDNKNTPYKLAGFTLVMWLLCWILVMLFINSDDHDWAKRGQFGDLFGSVNALFSGLAFAGIIYSIMQQQKELELTRKQVELGIEEQRNSNEEFKQQNSIMHLQRFDSNFFNMLTLHRQIANTFGYSSEAIGTSTVEVILRDFLNKLRNSEIEFYNKNLNSNYSSLYNVATNIFRDSIAVYIQSLCSVFDMVNDNKLIDHNDKVYYFSLLKSQIFLSERRLLFYHLSFIKDNNPQIPMLAKLEKELNILLTLDDQTELLHPSHHAIKEYLKELIKHRSNHSSYHL